jgi:phage-related protein
MVQSKLGGATRIRSSQKDYREFPPKVQDNFGFELFLAQTGQHPPSAKLLKGMGSGMVELGR